MDCTKSWIRVVFIWSLETQSCSFAKATPSRLRGLPHFHNFYCSTLIYTCWFLYNTCFSFIYFFPYSAFLIRHKVIIYISDHYCGGANVTTPGDAPIPDWSVFTSWPRLANQWSVRKPSSDSTQLNTHHVAHMDRVEVTTPHPANEGWVPALVERFV